MCTKIIERQQINAVNHKRDIVSKTKTAAIVLGLSHIIRFSTQLYSA